MYHQNPAFHLTQNELDHCTKLFHSASRPDGALKLLQKHFGDKAEGILLELTKGVDEFMTMNAQDIDSNTIRTKIDSMLEGKEPVDQLRMLTNVLTAMSYCGSTLHGNNAWTDHIELCKITLDAMNRGMVNADDPTVIQTIIETKAHLCAHIDSTAVLFVNLPQYEKVLQACGSANPDAVKAVAIESRQGNIAMAAAVYTLAQTGKLPSVHPETFTPYVAGVQTACHLAVDAAKKSGLDMEKVTAIIQKAARVLCILLVGAVFASLIAGVTLVGFSIVDTIFLFSDLEFIGTAVAMILMAVSTLISIRPVHDLGVRLSEDVIKVCAMTVSAVKVAYRYVSNWVINTVVPAAWPYWMMARDFVMTRIVRPAIAFFHKVREGAVELTDKAGHSLRTFASQVTEQISQQHSVPAPAAVPVPAEPVSPAPIVETYITEEEEGEEA